MLAKAAPFKTITWNVHKAKMGKSKEKVAKKSSVHLRESPDSLENVSVMLLNIFGL